MTSNGRTTVETKGKCKLVSLPAACVPHICSFNLTYTRVQAQIEVVQLCSVVRATFLLGRLDNDQSSVLGCRRVPRVRNWAELRHRRTLMMLEQLILKHKVGHPMAHGCPWL